MANLIKIIRNTINHWYIPLIVGIVFIVTSVLMFANPQATMDWFTIIFSASFLISGIGETVFGFSNRKELKNWGWILTFGILSTAVGILLMMNLDKAEIIFPYYVGFWVLFRAVGAIAFAIDLKQYGIMDWGNVMVLAVIGVLFGIILLWNPAFADMTVIFWAGLGVLALGIFNIYFAFKLRSIKRFPHKIKKEITDAIDNIQQKIKDQIQSLESSASSTKT